MKKTISKLWIFWCSDQSDLAWIQCRVDIFYILHFREVSSWVVRFVDWLRSWFLAQFLFCCEFCPLFKGDRGHLDCILFFRCLFPSREWKPYQRPDYERRKDPKVLHFYIMFSVKSLYFQDGDSHRQFFYMSQLYISHCSLHLPLRVVLRLTFILCSHLSLDGAHILAPNYWSLKSRVDFRIHWNWRCGYRNWMRCITSNHRQIGVNIVGLLNRF